jgi:hypothetical protein
MFPTSPKIQPHNSIKVIKLQWPEQFRAEFGQGPKEAKHIFKSIFTLFLEKQVNYYTLST